VDRAWHDAARPDSGVIPIARVNGKYLTE
jgi:hypothetical protein